MSELTVVQAISCLKHLSKARELEESPKLCADLIKIASLLSDLSKLQRNDGWISVEDRLPEPKTECLAFSEIYGGVIKAFHHLGTFYKSNISAEPIKTKYWQPLPPKPQKDK